MFKLKLKWQLVLPIVIVITIGVTTLQVFSFMKSSSLVEDLIEGSINRDTESASRFLTDRVDIIAKDIGNWAKNENFLNSVMGDAEATSHVNDFLQTALKDYPWFETLFLAGADGTVLAASSSQAVGLNVSDRKYFRTAMSGRSAISDPLKSKLTGNAIFVEAMPVRDSSGTVHGTLIGAINLQVVYDAVLAPIKIGKNGYAFLIDSKGTVIGHPNNKFVMDLNVSGSEYGKVMLSQKAGFYKYFFPEQNQWKVMAFQEIPQTGWIVSTTAPLGELLASLDTVRNTSIIGALVLIMLAGFVVSIIVGRITNTFGSFVDVFRTVAEGDLRVSIAEKDLNRIDEVGDMARALEQMTSKLSESISSISGATEEMSAGSSELSNSAQVVSQGASEQAASIEEISSSIEEITSSINQNAENAKQTQAIAVKAAADAEAGGEAVVQTVEAMNHIADKISIIEDIARQTNLLALNAAIEAARAGEHGKGFAVVAAEVRKLAEHSGNAAAEISELSVSSVKISEQAGDMLRTIIPDIKRTAELVDEITATCNEQGGGVSQINQAVQQFDSVIQTNASSSEEMASTSEQLAAQSEVLRSNVAYFSVNGNGRSNGTSRARVSRTPNMTLPAAAAKSSQLDLASGVRRNAVENVVVGDEGFERF